MLNWIVAWLISGLVYAAGDMTWIAVMGGRLYRPVIGQLLADRFDPRPGVVFYLIYATGIAAFAVAPGLRGGGWTRSVMWGALLGLVAYATYDLTNQVTLKVWSTRLSVIDIAWGTAITAVAAAAGCAAALAASKP